jgi:hypothetical protein
MYCLGALSLSFHLEESKADRGLHWYLLDEDLSHLLSSFQNLPAAMHQWVE